MRSAIDLKTDFDVVASLGDIIDVLKMSSLIQFRGFAARPRPNDAFLKEATLALSLLRSQIGEAAARHWYFREHPGLPSAIVVVTSDEGFLGDINALLVNAALNRSKADRDELIILGERGSRYFEDMKKRFTFFPGLTDEVSCDEAERVLDYLLQGYGRAFGRVIVVYSEFVSLSVQRIAVWNALPITDDTILAEHRHGSLIKGMLIEPTAASALDGVAEFWLLFKMLSLFWSAKQAEHAARIMNLEGSSGELVHLKHKLSGEYFRQVHALKDKVIREISAVKLIQKRT